MPRRSMLIMPAPAEHFLRIRGVPQDPNFVGRYVYLSAYLDDETLVGATWSITCASGQDVTINQNGRVEIGPGVFQEHVDIDSVYTFTESGITYTVNDACSFEVSYDNEFTLECPDIITGTTYVIIARFNSEVLDPNTVQWELPDGSEYAQLGPSGDLTITDSGTIQVVATYDYNGMPYTTSKWIEVVYSDSTHTETTVDPETGAVTTETTTETIDPETGASTTTTTSTTVNEDGTTTQSSSEVVVNQDGSSTSTSTTNSSDGSSSSQSTVTNSDGSSSSQSTVTNSDGTSSESQSSTTAPDPTTGSTTTSSSTTNYDANGNTTGSNTTDITNNTDGSYSSTSTNYDADGDPTDTTNQDRDSSGNIDTQGITYDDQGNSTVTSYNIDTSGNPGGTKDITGDGVNTEFVPFDGSEGFELHIRFKSRKQDQPNPPLVVDTEDTSGNYHFTILCSKDPNAPYPGFHIRWTLVKTNYNSGNIVFGYRGKTGSATNRNLALAPSTGDHANTYDYTISYDPTLKKYPSKFRLEDNLNGSALITLNIDFNPLAYALTLGYNINKQGQPYRYSNVEILDFTITKL